MRNILFALTSFCLAIAFTACHKSSGSDCGDPVVFNLKDTFSLCYGGLAKWSKDSKTTIQFNKVLGDNRCPSDVMCITAGGAKVSLQLAQSGSNRQDSVWIGDQTGGGLSDSVIVGNLRVRMLEVSPYPEKAGKAIPQEDYKIKLLVTDRKNQ